MNAFIRRIALGLGGLVEHDRQGKILFYHDIFSSRHYTDMGTSLELFEAHVRAIHKAGFTIVSHAPIEKNEVQICLDDGFRGVYECASWLNSNGIFPTIFIAPDLVGQQGYLSWSEIMELQATGFIFQSHTWSHRPLTEVPASELNHELLESRCFIADKLGREIDSICFPCGLFSDHIVEAAHQSGYKDLITSIPGAYRDVLPVSCAGAEKLRTRNLVQFLSAGEVVSVLKGGMRLFQRRYLKMHYKHD